MSHSLPPVVATVPRERMLYLEVEADSCPHTLLRVLGLLALQDRVALTISAERHAGGQHVLIGMEAFDEPAAQLLLAKIEAIVTVARARYLPPAQASAAPILRG